MHLQSADSHSVRPQFRIHLQFGCFHTNSLAVLHTMIGSSLAATLTDALYNLAAQSQSEPVGQITSLYTVVGQITSLYILLRLCSSMLSALKELVQQYFQPTDIEQRTYCMCGQHYDEDREWIGCPSCGRFYHRECVGLSLQEWHEQLEIDVMTWTCLNCRYQDWTQYHDT